MTAPTIDGFHYQALPGADDVELTVAVGGSGPAVVLLHGFPQTHYMWRDVARELTTEHTVIVADLRGYGDSGKPPQDGPHTYSKRTMARDVVRVADALGHERFGLIGHDRGALVGVRAGLDHPDVVQYLGILDVLPTLDTWDVLRGVNAKVAWPPQASTCTWITRTATPEGHFPCRLPSFPRTGAAQLGFDAAALWLAWAKDVTYEPINAGHFMAEEEPGEIVRFIRELAARARV